MYNIVRTYITTCILVMRGEEDQIDQNGRDKVIASVWAELPKLHAEIRSAVQQLLDEPSVAHVPAHDEEPQWLSAIRDEFEANAVDEGNRLDETDSWSELVRHIAILAFCLRQASQYAPDRAYGQEGFERIKSSLAALGQDEAVFVDLSFTRLIGQVEASGVPQREFILETYSQLHGSVPQFSN